MRRGMLAATLSVALTACVTTYHPLGTLQRPVAVDPQSANLEGVRILVRCLPTDELEASGAAGLCRRLRALLANQGAVVDVEVRSALGGLGPPAAPPVVQGSPADLVLEHRIFATEPANLWATAYLAAFTLTLFPLVNDRTFTHEIVIRDGRGALLAEERYDARFVETLSAPYWLLNWLLDGFIRPKSEALVGDGHQRDFSRDLYAQLSQITFNARMRSEVLNGLQPTTPATPATPATPPAPTRGAP